MITCGLNPTAALHKLDFDGIEAVFRRDQRRKCSQTVSHSPFGLRPHCDKGRALHFTAEVGNVNPISLGQQ